MPIHLAAAGGAGWTLDCRRRSAERLGRLVAGRDRASRTPINSAESRSCRLRVGSCSISPAKTRRGRPPGVSWSRATRPRCDVYDPGGKRVASLPARLGFLVARRRPRNADARPASLQVRSHGVGRPSVAVRVGRRGSIRWVSPTVVRPSGGTRRIRRREEANGDASRCVHGGGIRPAVARRCLRRTAVREARASRRIDGTSRAVTSYPMCQGKDADAFYYLQALPDGSGAVYAGDCAPPADVLRFARTARRSRG